MQQHDMMTWGLTGLQSRVSRWIQDDAPDVDGAWPARIGGREGQAVLLAGEELYLVCSDAVYREPLRVTKVDRAPGEDAVRVTLPTEKVLAVEFSRPANCDAFVTAVQEHGVTVTAAATPVAQPSSAVAGPPLTATVVVSLLFGFLLGWIPALIHSRDARAAGGDGQRYWKAYVITSLVSAVVPAVLVIALVASLDHSADPPGDLGGDLFSAAQSSATVDVEQPSTPQPAPAATHEITVTGVMAWDADYSADGGYQEHVTFKADPPIRDDDGLVLEGGLEPGSSCTVDPQKDALIPATLEATSETSGFDVHIGAGIAGGSGLQIEYLVGGESKCAEGDAIGGGASFYSVDAVPEGTPHHIPAWIVVSNYYTPEHPEGDPSVLDNAMLQFSPNVGFSDDVVFHLDPSAPVDAIDLHDLVSTE